MKIRNFFFAALAATFAFASCEPEADSNTGTNNGEGNGGGQDTPALEAQTGFVGAGEYWILAGDLAATPVGPEVSKQYGYLNVETAWKSSAAYASSETNILVFTEVEGGYTIQTKDGRYLYLSGTYNSFNYAAEAPAEGGHVWTVAKNDDGTYNVVNVLKNKTIQYSPSYGSFGAYDSPQTNAVLPSIVSAVNPIESVEVDVNDLQFAASGETKTLTANVPAGATVSAISDNAAFTVSINGTSVSVTAAEATAALTGDLTLTFTYGGYTVVKVVSLSQSAPSSGAEKTVTVTLGSSQTWTDATHTEYGAGFKLETDDFVVEHYKATSSNDVVATYAETRIYVGHVFMVTPKNGGQIKSVKLTTTGGKNGPLEIEGKQYTAENSALEWTGAVSVFKAIGKTQARVTQMVVIYE